MFKFENPFDLISDTVVLNRIATSFISALNNVARIVLGWCHERLKHSFDIFRLLTLTFSQREDLRFNLLVEVIDLLEFVEVVVSLLDHCIIILFSIVTIFKHAIIVLIVGELLVLGLGELWLKH